MKSTKSLVDEHCLIEQVLSCLERMVERCESQHRLEGEPARDVMTFFRGFTEHYHCSKEETQLIPTMRAMGISAEQCLGSSILQRREEGRLHLAAMEEAIDPASTGNATAVKEFTEHAHAYIELLLEYIAKQEDCLFPMIAEALPEADKARLETLLSTKNGDGENECSYDTFYDLANRLADHYEMPHTAILDSPANRTAETNPKSRYIKR